MVITCSSHDIAIHFLFVSWCDPFFNIDDKRFFTYATHGICSCLYLLYCVGLE